MKKSALKKFVLCLALLLSVAGCAAQETPVQEPGVEELSPGDKTMLDAPAVRSGSGFGVKEKNI